jgi:ribosome-binding protein aMBF1 (putative translation factor)
VKHWFPALITFKLPPTTQKDLDNLVTHNTETGKKITKPKSRKYDKLPDANQADSDSKPPQIKTNQATELTGAIVQQRRKAIRMSQTELAHAMGKSQSWVRDIENKLKDQVIKPKYALQLKFILGMS